MIQDLNFRFSYSLSSSFTDEPEHGQRALSTDCQKMRLYYAIKIKHHSSVVTSEFA